MSAYKKFITCFLIGAFCFALLIIYWATPIGNRPAFALGLFGEKYQKVVLLGSNDIYYVEEFTPWLEGDFAFNLYKGNGLMRVGQTGRLYKHDTDIGDPNTIIRFYKPGDDKFTVLKFIYKPTIKELISGDK